MDRNWTLVPCVTIRLYTQGVAGPVSRMRLNWARAGLKGHMALEKPSNFTLGVAQLGQDLACVFTRRGGRPGASRPLAVHAQRQSDILIVGNRRMISHRQ